MKRKVVLVQPKVGLWDDNLIRKYYKLPLSLLCVSRYLVDCYDVTIIDQRLDKNWRKTLKRELDLNPVCVGTTCLTGEQIKFALQISQHVKSISNIPMVWGGIHASIMPEQTVANPNIDIVVQGEGEISFFELVEALARGESIETIAGVWYKRHGEIFHTAPRDFADLNSFPPVPYELVDINAYSPLISLETSRGCPFRCRYCYNTNFNRGTWRSLSAENVVKELRRIKDKYGFTDFLFIDDNFFVNIERVRSILEAIERESLCTSWGSSGMRIDTVERVDYTFFELLKRTGCISVEVGIESCSDKVLKIINKGLTKERILRLNREFARSKIEMACNFMVGFPGEEIEDLKETARAIVTMAEDNPYMKVTFVSIYQPYPGTALYSECLKLGLKEAKSLEEWIDRNWESVANWRSKELNDLLNSINSTGYGLRHNRKTAPRGVAFEVVAALARQVSIFRFKHFFFRFMVENYLKRLVEWTAPLS
ncbi:MAG: B12-binding domain-containing radical SAM protein [Deltaproteobacteria bacterium]|nr:B12-binding domain-containing radical SAM protein [Deltaproteobacteria bacterium]